MKDDKQTIEELSNLCFVLIEFCKKTEQTQDIQGITALVDCIYNKVEKLYIQQVSKNC